MTVAYPTYHELDGIPCTKYFSGLIPELAPIPRSTFMGIGFSGYGGRGMLGRTVTGNHIMRLLTDGSAQTTAVEPTWNTSNLATTVDGAATWQYVETMPADSFPPGATALSPGVTGKTFVNQSDVFFRAVGLEAYYETALEVETSTHFSYRTGAIVMFSQSYSADPVSMNGTDYEFGTPVLGGYAAFGPLNAKSPVRALLSYTINVNNFLPYPFSLMYAGADAAATVTCSTPGTLLLNSTVVGNTTIVIPSGTLRSQLVYIKSQLPAGWTAALVDGGMASRSDVAIRNGACAFWGSCAEPQSSGANKAAYLVQNLWHGMSLGEAAYTQDDVIGSQTNYVVGDPLYRPFGHRR